MSENAEDIKEKEIDLLQLAARLWSKRKKLLIWALCGAVIGLVIGFSIPKEYVAGVKLAPESNGNKSGAGGLGALASMAGLSGGNASSADAVYPMLYPEVVKSVPFATSLFNIPVRTEEDDKDIPLQQYLSEDLRSPWWSGIMKFPGKIISLFRSKEAGEKNHKLDNFRLTLQEDGLVRTLNERITTAVDVKTSVISVTVTMQDPLVAATVADSVVSRLQEYITDYRTNKARQDLDYAIKLNQEAKENYYQAQQRFANYLDRNQGIVLNSAQITRDRLENEATLAFNLYNQTAQQVQRAQAKVQETTPVYAIISPATVPVTNSSPRKALILVAFTFLAFVCGCAWILFVQPLLSRGRSEE